MYIFLVYGKRLDFFNFQLFTLREQQSKSRHSSGSTEETMKLMKNEQKDVEITKPEPLPKV